MASKRTGVKKPGTVPLEREDRTIILERRVKERENLSNLVEQARNNGRNLAEFLKSKGWNSEKLLFNRVKPEFFYELNVPVSDLIKLGYKNPQELRLAGYTDFFELLHAGFRELSSGEKQAWLSSLWNLVLNARHMELILTPRQKTYRERLKQKLQKTVARNKDIVLKFFITETTSDKMGTIFSTTQFRELKPGETLTRPIELEDIVANALESKNPKSFLENFGISKKDLINAGNFGEYSLPRLGF